MILENVSETIGVFANIEDRVEMFNKLMKMFLPLNERNISLTLEEEDKICYVKLTATNISLTSLLSAQRNVTKAIENL